MARKERYDYDLDFDPEAVPEIDSGSRYAGEGDPAGSQAQPAARQAKPRSGFVAFWCDRRTHAVIGIGLILVAAYLFIAALSYFQNATHDQSVVSNLSVEQIVAGNQAVDNVAGPAGAVAAHLMLTNGLGLGSLVLVVYLVVLGVGLIGLRRKINFWPLTLKCLVSAVGVSMIAGVADLYFNSESLFPAGGFHGRYINLWLIARIEWVGTLAISLFLLALLTFIYVNDFLELCCKMGRAFSRGKAIMGKQANDTSAQWEGLDEDEESDPEEEQLPVDILGDHSAYMPKDSPEGEDPEPVSVNFKEDLPVESVDESQETQTEESMEPTITDKNNIESTKAERVIDEPGFEVSVNAIEQGEEDCSALYDPTAELSRYQRPSLDLLINRVAKSNSVDRVEQDENKERITKTLRDYGIEISRIQATVGPTVTLYEIIPAEGVRIAKIKRLEDDIAMSLAALGIRIIAPIPGKGTIGIEVPNKEPQTVSIRAVLGSKAFQECRYELPMAMGATISNDIYIADLAKMPHLLVAGATGQGKSVGLNTIIASLLYKKHPSELKFVLVDPKMVEFSLYSKLEKHFMACLEGEEEPVITDTEKVERTLNSLCVEMENRYKLLKDANVRSLTEYNAKFAEHRLNPEKGHRYLPYIVIIVDEFADLIMTSGKAIETPIARIAQKARAVGMHMIIATQRPSTNVITGIIKANFPGRIAFRVSQMVDSKTILDRTGANQLIGRGDMLFSHNGSMERVQCAFIDTPEVEAIVESISSQVGFDHPYFLPEPLVADGEASIGSITDRDPLFDDCARYLCAGGDTASTSSLQRKFAIGYNRAGKIMDQLEAAGIVSAAQGSKPRNVLMDIVTLESIL